MPKAHGVIALAGIIVRNSILLVDFTNLQVRAGMDLIVTDRPSGKVRISCCIEGNKGSNVIKHTILRPLVCGNSFLVAIAVLAVSASVSAQERGMTWGAMPTNSSPAGTTLVSCHGGPAPQGLDKCDAYSGDTSCATTLPVLCVNPARLQRPANLYHPGTQGVVPDPGFYSGWSGARLALSRPVPGTTLQSIAVANAMCAKQFGSGWRMGEFHDGNVDRGPVSMVVTDPNGNSRNISVRGGWGFYGLGKIPATSRFWVQINDQPANCWDHGKG